MISARTHLLGQRHRDGGASPQLVVPHGHWQRARPRRRARLVSCVVVLGFDFGDFELGAVSD